jgi:hypothetical protein
MGHVVVPSGGGFVGNRRGALSISAVMSRAAAVTKLRARAHATGEEVASVPDLRSVPLEAGGATAIWEATETPARAVALPQLGEARERAIVEALLRPIDPCDGHRLGNERKEQEVCALFAALPVLEAMELHRRLRIARAGDAVAAAFARLVVERRQRLLAFLGEAPRRAALGRG